MKDYDSLPSEMVELLKSLNPIILKDFEDWEASLSTMNPDEWRATKRSATGMFSTGWLYGYSYCKSLSARD